MEANLAKALPILEVAKLAGQSQREMTRLFQRHFGETPLQCYMGMRLDRARQLLADSRCLVTEAALATGSPHTSLVPTVVALEKRQVQRQSVAAKLHTDYSSP